MSTWQATCGGFHANSHTIDHLNRARSEHRHAAMIVGVRAVVCDVSMIERESPSQTKGTFGQHTQL